MGSLSAPHFVIPAKAGTPLSFDPAESFAQEQRVARGWVYIMAGRYRGTLYIGVTTNLAARVQTHRQGRGSSFCSRYGLTRLVHAEEAPTIYEAIAREKALKKWNRAWKIELIEAANPNWLDLFETINA